MRPLAAGWSDSSSTGSQSGSESDTGSDAGSSSRGGGWDTAAAVRLAALSCLQQLAKADGRALHPFWIVLLPVYNPLQTKYHDATLMDAVVRDPVPKVTVLLSSMGLQGSTCHLCNAVLSLSFKVYTPCWFVIQCCCKCPVQLQCLHFLDCRTHWQHACSSTFSFGPIIACTHQLWQESLRKSGVGTSNP